MNKLPYIKICCIENPQEAKTATQHGASAVGLVGKMPGGPGIIDDKTIREIARSVPPPVASFLLTSEILPEKIVGHHERTRTSVIQLVDEVEKSTYLFLREKLPAVKLVQVVHVIDEKSVDYALNVSGYVDALLLDSGNPNAKVKELGGTGRVHNWKLSREIRNKASVPVFLAGGLTPENIGKAIKTVQPFGVDVCSGLRTNGKLDTEKLSRFMQIIRNIENT